MHTAARRHFRRLLVLPVALGLFAIAPQAASARYCPDAGADPNGTSIRKIQKATLCLLNNRREHHGLPALRENSRLDLASMRHAQDMARRHYFEHGDFIGRIKATDYLSGAGAWTVGENIAWGSGGYGHPAAIVRMWMNSPPHRENILSRDFHEIGLGVARGAPVRGYDDGATYATDFGARS